MSAIPDEIIEQVRDAADPVTVIGEHVQLKRTGSDWRGPCPFHGGTHRNLAVIPKKQMFYCFVCHEGGDVFSFYMKQFGMDYPTAVREVARRVGITIPERSTAGPDPREPLFEAAAVAHEWFTRQLREADDAEPARRYLADRGFALEAMLPYGLGWAPAGRTFLEAMGTLGISPERLIRAGLAVERDEGQVRSRFWNRLLFPIHDLRGRVVGFGGRVIGDGEPKYLNSPESEIFHKGRLLYHLHDARHAIRQADRAIIVEGYFDVIRLVEADIGHVVAPLGTGFTSDQARLLRRITQQVVILFDSDAPGLRATFRVADELLRAGARVLVATMPDGEDPDTLARQGGGEAVQAIVRDAIDVLERKLQLLERKGWLGSLAGRRRALDRLLPTLRAAADPVTRDLYVSRVGEALGISRDSVMREVGLARDVPYAGDRRVTDRDRTSRANGPGPERNLAHVMVHRPEFRGRVLELLPEAVEPKSVERELIERLGRLDPGESASGLLDDLDDLEVRALLQQLIQIDAEGLDASSTVHDAINLLQSRGLEGELTDIKRRLPLVSDTEKEEMVRDLVVKRTQANELTPNRRWEGFRRGRNT